VLKTRGSLAFVMGAILDYFRQLLGFPPTPREFVVRLFPEVEYALLTGLIQRVKRLELTEVGAVVDLKQNQQAAMCVERGALESVKLASGVWEAFCSSSPGTVFNTAGLQRKLKGPGMCRVAKKTTLMLLSADDFEAELQMNQPLAETLRSILPVTAAEDSDPEMEDADVDREPEPPSARRVASRAIALAAVSERGLLENEASGIKDAEQARQELVDWVTGLGITDELEPEEWKALQRPVGRLERQDAIDAVWRIEGLAILAWALRWYDPPAYDELVRPPLLFDAVRILEPGAMELLSEPTLRAPEELASMREHLLAFHWRMRDFSVRPHSMDFVQFSKKCWFGSFDISRFRIIDNDLAIGDEAIHRADTDEVDRVQSIAFERHRAINWLMGYDTIYSETDTST